MTYRVGLPRVMVDAGTAFPSLPQDGDQFYRTDLDSMWVYRSALSAWRPYGLLDASQRLVWVRPTTGAAMGAMGTSVTLSGGSTQTPSSTSPWEATIRGRSTSTAATNSNANIRTGLFALIGTSASYDGYRVRALFGFATALSGHRMLCGMVAQATALSAGTEPDAFTSYVGVIARTTDTNWQISSRRSGVVDITDAGANFPKTLTNTPLELWISVAPNSTNYEIELRRLDTGAVFTHTITSGNSPGTSTAMAFHLFGNTSGSSTAITPELAALDAYRY